MSFNIVTELSSSFHPYPKKPRIKNKKLLKDKKRICQFCGRRDYTDKHHIKTKGSGGDDIKENLVELCRKCHSLVHAGVIEKDELLKIIRK